MKLNKKMCRVAADLEEIIGSECYHPTAYDGWNDIEGCSFRYPLSLPCGEDRWIKVRQNLMDDWFVKPGSVGPDTIRNMRYRFGSNQLLIGRGILAAMEYLEERYGLDFNALEEKRMKETVQEEEDS